MVDAAKLPDNKTSLRQAGGRLNILNPCKSLVHVQQLFVNQSSYLTSTLRIGFKNASASIYRSSSTGFRSIYSSSGSD